MADISVIGSGSWGTAVTYLLAKNGHSVKLWSYFAEESQRLAREKENKEFLPGVILPDTVFFTNDIKEALAGSELVITAVPSHAMRTTAEAMRPFIDTRAQTILNISKGLEEGTLMRLSQVIADCIPAARVAVMSGPSHAEEVGKLMPTTNVVSCKDIALANKETLVTAGHLIMPMAKEKGVQILPVDSEHSAIFQAIHGEDKREIHKLLITASGGPFRGMKASDLAHVKVEDALKHPNWAMGQKITIDSATLVNKGLEVMEAKWLFDVDLDHIQVVVQPKSIIHSMVEFVDGAVMAQLGTPDMKLPIQYALYYPHRRYLPGERLDFKTLTEITFEEPDMETFLGLPMAMEASRRGGSMPTVFNAANERAVAKFLHGQIGFLDIYRSIREAMDRHQVIEHPCLEEILETEAKTYEWMESRWSV